MSAIRIALFPKVFCVFVLAYGLAAALWTAPTWAANEPEVVIVHSYNPEYVWTQRINEGILDGLSDMGTVNRIFYMDAKRLPSPAHLEEVAQRALRYIEQANPDVVICVDDVAQIYLGAKHLKGRKTPQVVFCGVNAPLENYGYPASNVSGVREQWHYRDAFALVKKIIPGARSVAFLVEDSESGHFVLNDLKKELRQGGPYALELVGAETVHTLGQWKERVLHYKDTADVLALGLYNSLLDEQTGTVAVPDEVSDWTQGVINNPTVGFSDIAKRNGILCGVLESGHEQGFLAGGMARQIMENGVPAGSLPVRINLQGIVFLNLKTAERLGIKIPYQYIEAASEILR